MRQGVALFAAAVGLAASLPFLRKHDGQLGALLAKMHLAAAPAVKAAAQQDADGIPPLADVDLANLDDRREVITAPAHGKRSAELTLDPIYQQAAEALLLRGQMHLGAVIMTEVATGRVLAYASVNSGRRRDVCLEAIAPSASVFKIVTGSALVEQGVPLSEKVCYGGGEHSLSVKDLQPDEERDKWCASVPMAMGRSINAVFARLALKVLDREKLRCAAMRLGYVLDIPFDVPVAPSALEVPDDDLEYARMAAGFWHTTLSPVAAVNLALTVASGGEMIRQHIVERVVDEDQKTLYQRPAERQVLRRALDERTAWAVARMMEQTVQNGTSFQSFHDRTGRQFLPDIRVAGKTGTLAEKKTDTLYTWWVGFAPARQPEVALSVLVVNRGQWRVKATHVAADMLRIYFADRGHERVRPPPGIRLRKPPKEARPEADGAGSADPKTLPKTLPKMQPSAAPAQSSHAPMDDDDEATMEATET